MGWSGLLFQEIEQEPHPEPCSANVAVAVALFGESHSGNVEVDEWIIGEFFEEFTGGNHACFRWAGIHQGGDGDSGRLAVAR